jgi:hypothetical protein
LWDSVNHHVGLFVFHVDALGGIWSLVAISSRWNGS